MSSEGARERDKPIQSPEEGQTLFRNCATEWEQGPKSPRGSCSVLLEKRWKGVSKGDGTEAIGKEDNEEGRRGRGRKREKRKK